jgi:hypothetical protein
MTQPPIAPKSRWASLWGGSRNADTTKTAEELRAEHAAKDAALAKADRRDLNGRPAPLEQEDEDADGNPLRPPEYTLRVKGYGGVTVQRADSPTTAFLGILAMCERHLPAWDPVLTRFGVLVAPLAEAPKIAHYVRRTGDGMTLAVPDAQSREDALLHIVQALIELQVKNRAVFGQYGVQAFRNG